MCTHELAMKIQLSNFKGRHLERALHKAELVYKCIQLRAMISDLKQFIICKYEQN